MKKMLTLIAFATFLLGTASAQTPTAQKDYAKETLKMFKQLSPEAQQRVFEYAEREVKVQEAMTQKAQTPTKTATTPVIAPTPTTTLPAVTPATSPNSDSPEYIVKAEKMAKTTIKWDTDSHDFGKITEGEKVTHRFTFKNTGEAPLLITMVKPSCGCTSPEWSKEEIAPGKEGFIEIIFNSAGKSGMQRKNVSVYLNTDPIMRNLTFTGEVIVPNK